MSIYQRNKSHRRIYEHHFGPIPKGYHIHHIDGNHSNNHIDNLQCITAQEHYNIHKDQGDYGCCWAMIRTGHLKLSDEERSDLAKKQMEDTKMKDILSKSMKKKSDLFWANTEYRQMQVSACKERFTKLWSDDEYKSKVSARIADSWNKKGRREKQADEMSRMVSENNKKELCCPHCGKVGRGIGIMNRWHFDNCRKKEI